MTPHFLQVKQQSNDANLGLKGYRCPFPLLVDCFSLCMAFAAISYKEKNSKKRKPQSMKTDECKTIDRGSS